MLASIVRYALRIFINNTVQTLCREMAYMHIDMFYFTIFLRPWH